MITKEKLSDLVRNTLRMLTYIDVLGIKDNNLGNLENKIKDVLRKLVVADMIGGKQIIAICGEQGAGKSTLVKNLYGFEPTVFPITEGRGEVLPILISEYEGDENKYIAYKIEYGNEGKEYNIVPYEIEKESFANASKQESDNVVFLEIKTPFKHFNNTRSAFMLMPGFEKPTEYWQSLINFAVACSDASIMVYTYIMLAGDESTKVAKKVKTLLNEVKPIFVVTQAEDLSDEQKKQVVDNTVVQFNFSAEEEDRIVFVVNQDEKTNDVWIHKLIEDCEKYALTEKQSSKNQKQYVTNAIKRDYKKMINELRKIVESLEIDNFYEIERDPLIIKFDKANKDKLVLLKKQLNNNMKDAAGESKKTINEKFAKDSEKRDSTFTKVRKFFIGENAADIIQSENLIAESMLNMQRKSRIALAYEKSLNALIGEMQREIDERVICVNNQNKGRLLEDVRNLNIDERNYEMMSLENTHDSEESTVLQNEHQEKLLRDMTSVLLSKNDSELSTIETKDLSELANAIHSCAVMVYAKNISDAINKKMVDLSEVDGDGETTNASEKICSVSKETAAILISTLGIIDYGSDGDFEIVEKLSDTLGVSASAITAVFAGISIGLLAQRTAKNINRRDVKEMQSFRSVIMDAYKEARDNCFGRYEDYMNEIRERLVQYIQRYHGINSKDAILMNARILLTNAEDNMYEICDEIEGQDILSEII